MQVTLLTLPDQAWPITHERFSKVELGLGKLNRLVRIWSFNHAVVKYLSRHKVDCALSLDKVALFTHLHAGGGTHKSFLKIRSQYARPVNRFFRKLSLFHWYTLRLERKGFENPMLRKVRCNSEMVKRDIQNDYNVPDEKLTVVHSGIRWQEMKETFQRREEIARELCEIHQLAPDEPYLLFLGSGFSRKGLDIAIQGLKWMPESYHLVVVGKGSTSVYQRLAADLGLAGRLHFLGPQPQGWRYAAMCKALVLPSQYDPFGGASAEGHAMGLPVLVSDTTGYVDRVIHGENGIILNTPMTSSNIEKAFNALAELIAHPRWRAEQLREHARFVDDDVILDRLFRQFLML